jgi:hypothetical protein
MSLGIVSSAPPPPPFVDEDAVAGSVEGEDEDGPTVEVADDEEDMQVKVKMKVRKEGIREGGNKSYYLRLYCFWGMCLFGSHKPSDRRAPLSFASLYNNGAFTQCIMASGTIPELCIAAELA